MLSNEVSKGNCLADSKMQLQFCIIEWMNEQMNTLCLSEIAVVKLQLNSELKL